MFYLFGSLLDELKNTLGELFTKLKKSLNLNDENFTSNMILQQVLNETDLKLRAIISLISFVVMYAPSSKLSSVLIKILECSGCNLSA